MGGMLCSKRRIIDEVNDRAKIEDENPSEKTFSPNYQPSAGILCMRMEQREISINNKCTLLLKLQLLTRVRLQNFQNQVSIMLNVNAKRSQK